MAGKVYTMDQLARAFQVWPPKQRGQFVRTLNGEMKLLAKYIKRKFFRTRGQRRRRVIIDRTGALRNSVRAFKVKLRGGILEAGVQMGGASAPYAPFIEHGTRGPYIIVPKRPGGWLRWKREDGSFAFAKRVVHPGIRARAPLSRGVKMRQKKIFRSIQKAHFKQLKQVFG